MVMERWETVPLPNKTVLGRDVGTMVVDGVEGSEWCLCWGVGAHLTVYCQSYDTSEVMTSMFTSLSYSHRPTRV